MTRTASSLGLAGACALALALAPATVADARLGDLDPSFGGDGVVLLGDATSLQDAAVRADGSVTVAGQAVGVGVQTELLIARLTAAGAADPTFGGGDGIVSFRPAGEAAVAAAVAPLPDGQTLVAGATATGSLETNPQHYLGRLSAAGDPTGLPFARPTALVASSFTAMEVLPDGDIVLAGWGTVGMRDVMLVTRRDPDGSPDPGFNAAGTEAGWRIIDFANSVGARAQELTVDATGAVTLVGQVDRGTLAPLLRGAAARVARNGAPDATFGGDGQVEVGYPAPFAGNVGFAGAALRDTTLLAAGTIATGPQGVLQAIGPDGGFPVHGTAGAPQGAAVWPGHGEAVALTSTGGAVVAGRTTSDALQTAWLTSSGTPDPAAGGIRGHAVGLLAGAAPMGAAVGAGDSLVVAGTSAGGQGVVARFAPNAAPVPALSAPAQLQAGAPAEISAAGSSDPEDEPLRYAFDLDGDGAYEFDGGENPLALRSFAVPGSYTVGVRVSDPRGAAATVQRSIAVVAGPALPQPVLGKQGVARPVRGTIRFRLPGQKRFRPMLELTAIPNGTEIDARKGRVLLTVLHDASGALDGARFYAGRFIFRQGAGAVPLTTLKLTNGTLAKCRKRTTAGAGRALAVAARIPRSSGNRRLWGDGRGRFRTRGRYGAATVRGTKWLTDDRCDGTLVRVKRGKVDVQDLQRPRRRPTRVKAGQELFVKQRGA
ncbi:MAG TPA: PKD domain-containing protein [Solirubrobacteraceae bacterium]|nr:PKD domain-containing protein [Solirubrobacteraceae bacterium]